MSEHICLHCRLLGVPTAPAVVCPQCGCVGALLTVPVGGEGWQLTVVQHEPLEIGGVPVVFGCAIGAPWRARPVEGGR